MRVLGIKTKTTLNGQVSEDVEGDLAVFLTKIHSTDPYPAEGKVTIHYNALVDGELLPGKYSPAELSIQDIPADTVIGDTTYGKFILDFKEVSKFIVQRNIDNCENIQPE